MPIYEYQCTACGHALEALQKMSDEPIKTCPGCQKDTLSKLVSAPSFQLKGTGWYATDFKTKPPAAKATESSEPAKTEVKATPEPTLTTTKDKASD
jgi:putative FmdB family regulatory protein